MAWRGLYEDVLGVLKTLSTPIGDPESNTKGLALKAAAFTHLGNLYEADQLLTKAEAVCLRSPYSTCGDVMQARGVFALERGDHRLANESFLKFLKFAKARKDRWSEASALLNLGNAALEAEHYDEALDWSKSAYRAALEIGGEGIAQTALGNQGWAYYGLGDYENALQLFIDAENRAAKLGNTRQFAWWLTTEGDVYATTGQLPSAEKSYLRALDLAVKIKNKEDVVNASMDLAQVDVELGKLDDADHYSNQAWSMAQQSGNRLDMLNSHLIQGQAAALRRDWNHAESLFHEVIVAPESQISMKWTAEHALANLYESQGRTAPAQHAYQAALTTFEGARAELKQEDSQLPFLANATGIYDDYIGFLVKQGKATAALEAADWSRARTLEQGLGLIPKGRSVQPLPFSPSQIARKANATLLFYWLGDKQSYLWAISPEKTLLIPLPAKREIIPLVVSYRQALLKLQDPARDESHEGVALYNMLVAPASSVISPQRPVILIVDRELSQLNFETLLVAAPKRHYFIEDATILSAPSIRMLTAAKPKGKETGKLLLMGDAISPDPEYPDLRLAALEIKQVQKHFVTPTGEVFTKSAATPMAYLNSNPEQFSYIHFAAHASASRLDPLDSAVILSRPKSGADSYKLYARDILQHPINARLVTMSACYSSGNISYAGEGLVGLSWAFLRAGAHNTVGALWDVSDESTPRLMDQLYSGLEQGKSPAVALRAAKLTLLNSGGTFRRPFYWAPFQLYAGR